MKNNREANHNMNPTEWLIKANKYISEEGKITNIIRINEHQVRAKVWDSSSGSKRVVYYDYKEDKIINRYEIDRDYSSIIDAIDELEQSGNCVMAFSIDGNKVTFRIFNDATLKETTEVREIRRYDNRNGKPRSNDKSTKSRHGRRN